MKVELSKENVEFKPITFSVTLENIQELHSLRHVLGWCAPAIEAVKEKWIGDDTQFDAQTAEDIMINIYEVLVSLGDNNV